MAVARGCLPPLLVLFVLAGGVQAGVQNNGNGADFDSGWATDAPSGDGHGLSPMAAGAGTFAAWVRVDTNPVSNSYGTIISFGIPGVGTHFAMGIREIGGTNTVYAYGRVNSTGWAQSAGTIPATGVWFHVAVVYEANGSLTVYLNGTGTNTATAGGTQTHASRYIGYTRAVSGSGFHGSIAHLSSWAAALTAAEVGTLASGGDQRRVRRWSMKRYFRFDVDSGNAICELTGTSIPGGTYWSTTTSPPIGARAQPRPRYSCLPPIAPRCREEDCRAA